jgi:hypothetical protein
MQHTRNFATAVLVRAVDFLVFPLVRRTHVPIKPVFQTKRLVLILYALEFVMTPAQRAGRMDEMRLGLRDQPVRQRLRDAANLLFTQSAMNRAINTSRNNGKLHRGGYQGEGIAGDVRH